MSEPGKVHQVGDGILEEDNHLPNWWLATLFGAMIFAFGYWEYYHVLKVGLLPMQEYAVAKRVAAERTALAAANKPAPSDDELKLLAKGPDATVGATVFQSNCMVCHGASGEGKIGPNLTDEFWIHGERPQQLYASIQGGYPLKGMPAWGPVLGADKVREVTAYVMTIQGKNLPGKPPER